VPDRISDSRSPASIDECAAAHRHLRTPRQIIEERKARVCEVRRIHHNGTARGLEGRSLRCLVAYRRRDHRGAPDACSLHRRGPRGADVIVRITADCPLTDPAVVDSIVRARSDHDSDYASNVEPPTFPEGYDCEVFTSACLGRVDREATLAYEREHVTVRVREHMADFRTTGVAHDPDLSGIRLTVDVPADLDRVRRLLDTLPLSPPPDLGAVVAAFEGDPLLQDQSGLPLRNERYRAQREAAHRT